MYAAIKYNNEMDKLCLIDSRRAILNFGKILFPTKVCKITVLLCLQVYEKLFKDICFYD